jgi:hypothetical protein
MCIILSPRKQSNAQVLHMSPPAPAGAHRGLSGVDKRSPTPDISSDLMRDSFTSACSPFHYTALVHQLSAGCNAHAVNTSTRPHIREMLPRCTWEPSPLHQRPKSSRPRHSLAAAAASLPGRKTAAALVTASVPRSTTRVWNTTVAGACSHISVRSVSPGNTCAAKRPCRAPRAVGAAAQAPGAQARPHRCKGAQCSAGTPGSLAKACAALAAGQPVGLLSCALLASSRPSPWRSSMQAHD